MVEKNEVGTRPVLVTNMAGPDLEVSLVKYLLQDCKMSNMNDLWSFYSHSSNDFGELFEGGRPAPRGILGLGAAVLDFLKAYVTEKFFLLDRFGSFLPMMDAVYSGRGVILREDHSYKVIFEPPKDIETSRILRKGMEVVNHLGIQAPDGRFLTLAVASQIS